MDSKKLTFLKAVVGQDGAEALHRAAERSSELAGAIYPRAILAWLDVVDEFDGVLPGTSCRAAFKKSPSGYDGYVTVGDGLYDFNKADTFHLAGAIAVSIGADDHVDTSAEPTLLAKLGKSVDLLIKSRAVRQELEKTSWNVKQQRRYQYDPQLTLPGVKVQPKPLTTEQVTARRQRYAQSIGLKPEEQTLRPGAFPSAKRNTLPYSGNFGLEHEASHAMMTPDGNTINEYQKWLTRHAKPSKAAVEDFDDDLAHEEAVGDENIANAIEPHFDRRAGVDPHAFASEFRNTLVSPENKDVAHYDYDEDYADKDVAPRGVREMARIHVGKFDDGSKFDQYGRIQPPKGVDAKINQRADRQLGKDEIKAKAKNRIQLPGQAAKPNAPQEPTAPTPKQPKMQTAQPGAVATSPAKLTTPEIPNTGIKAAGVQLPKAPKAPKGAAQSTKVIKSHAYTRCDICGGAQFRGAAFIGCRCFSALAKSVTVTETKTHFQISFGDDWDADAIDALMGALRK